MCRRSTTSPRAWVHYLLLFAFNRSVICQYLPLIQFICRYLLLIVTNCRHSPLTLSKVSSPNGIAFQVHFSMDLDLVLVWFWCLTKACVLMLGVMSIILLCWINATGERFQRSQGLPGRVCVSRAPFCWSEAAVFEKTTWCIQLQQLF